MMTQVILAGLLLATVPVQDVGVSEHLGAHVPLDIRLVGSAGDAVSSGTALRGTQPTILVMAYYKCPMLCGLVLNAVGRLLPQLDAQPGKDFNLVTVSFAPEDDSAAARDKQQSILAGLGGAVQARDWPFYVTDALGAEKLMNALGLHAVRDADTGDYAHPAVIMVLSPTGQISRYVYGIDFAPRDVRLALLEASQERVGSSWERLLLRCYAYDPAHRRYMPVIQTFMRVGASVILIAVAGLVAFLFWRQAKHSGGRL